MMMDTPTCGARLTSPTPDLDLVAREFGWKRALDWGKPLANGGSHDVDNATGAVLLLEGDIEVLSPPPQTYLSRVKTQSFSLGGGSTPALFSHWRCRLEIAGLVDELAVAGLHRLSLLPTAWSGLLWSRCGWW
jgi:hypothetical protein